MYCSKTPFFRENTDLDFNQISIIFVITERGGKANDALSPFFCSKNAKFMSDVIFFMSDVDFFTSDIILFRCLVVENLSDIHLCR